MTPAEADARRAAAAREAQFRYVAVFLLVVTLLLFEVLSPDADWSRAIGFALAGAALSVAVMTSRARADVRRARAWFVAGVALVVVIAIATGLLSPPATYVIGTLVLAAIPVALAGGVLRLINEDGVTIQAVAGALAIYLLIGLLFASAISFVDAVQHGTYFTQTSHPPNGIRVYYSFTVITTTGFGDYTARTSVGHALAVLEMLTGQLYLVTVIGVLVGNFVGRRMTK